jgi:hypothetical protein
MGATEGVNGRMGELAGFMFEKSMGSRFLKSCVCGLSPKAGI